MEVRIDGFRSTSENWLRASLASGSELPKLTPEEDKVAQKLGIQPESYARERYAQELTDSELRDKAITLGNWVQAWLEAQRVAGTIESVWLKTFEGRYRLDFFHDGKHSFVFVDESLVDEIFERGSSQARNSLENILEMSLLPAQAARAS